MPAGIFNFHVVVLVEFFARLNSHRELFTFIHFEIAGVGIDNEIRVDQFTMIVQQPVHAVEIAAFFIGGQRENQVAIGTVAFFFHADERGDEKRVAFFDVLGAAAVEVAVLLDELEWVHAPVFAVRFDDIEMADEEDWLAHAGAMNSRDEIALPRIGPEHLNVVAGESRAAQPCCHRLSGDGRAAHRICGVDLDELFENVVRHLPRGRVRLRAE